MKTQGRKWKKIDKQLLDQSPTVYVLWKTVDLNLMVEERYLKISSPAVVKSVLSSGQERVDLRGIKHEQKACLETFSSPGEWDRESYPKIIANKG